jgi:hypothetical protein
MATVSGIHVETSSARETFKSGLFAIIGGSLIFITGLSWNEFFQSVFRRYFGPTGSLIAQLIYALLLTLIVIIVIFILARILIKPKPPPENTFTVNI